MMVEINLLEEKEKRNLVPYIMVLIVVLGMVFFFVYVTSALHSLASEKTALESDISRVQAEQQLIQQGSKNEKETSREELETMTENVEATLIPSVDLLERFTALLPERGYFLDYTYNKDGNLDIRVQFDSLQEVAQYTNALSQEDYIRSVVVENIDTEQIEGGDIDILPRYAANYTVTMDPVAYKQEVIGDEN